MASPNAAGTNGAKESSLTTVISRVARGNIPYFYKVMTKTAVTQQVLGPFAYALGFPVSFVRAQGNKFCEKATFQPRNCDQMWPIKITMKEEQTSKHPVIRVFAYGAGGWKDFVVDNHIQVGDTLVFSLVEDSRFMIDIIKAVPAEGHEEEEEEDLSVNASSFPKHVEEALVPCRKVPPQDGPRFWVTPTEVNQLGVPVYFWKHLNHDMLPSRDWQLKGPNGAVMLVEAEGSFYEQKIMDIHLKSGWKEFFVENNLRIGHLLEFSLVRRHCFTVDVLDSDCKRFQRFAGVDLFSG